MQSVAMVAMKGRKDGDRLGYTGNHRLEHWAIVIMVDARLVEFLACQSRARQTAVDHGICPVVHLPTSHLVPFLHVVLFLRNILGYGFHQLTGEWMPHFGSPTEHWLCLGDVLLYTVAIQEPASHREQGLGIIIGVLHILLYFEYLNHNFLQKYEVFSISASILMIIPKNFAFLLCFIKINSIFAAMN